MTLAIIALTRNGSRLGARLQAACPGATLYVPARFAAEGGAAATPFAGELKELVAGLWPTCRAFAFIMATGIVVRTVAPLLAGKERDPAVVVLDEAGQFAIPLLSGHLGGANQLAGELAAALGAVPVITTATDVNGLTAWDEAARLAGLAVEPLGRIKDLNSLLLEGAHIALVDEHGLVAPRYAATPGVELYDSVAAALAGEGAGLVVVGHRVVAAPAGRPLLSLRPRDLVAGIGCNRGTSAGEIEAVLRAALTDAGLSFASLAALASIDAKADEPGLLEFAARRTLPLTCFTAEQLNAVPVPSPASPHALAAVGARGVCEPAALLAAAGGPLLVNKHKSGNVTVAVAEMNR